jgi:hypothetical protein
MYLAYELNGNLASLTPLFVQKKNVTLHRIKSTGMILECKKLLSGARHALPMGVAPESGCECL